MLTKLITLIMDMQVHHQSLIIGKVYQYLHNAAMEKLRSQLILEDSILGYLQILTMLCLLYYSFPLVNLYQKWSPELLTVYQCTLWRRMEIFLQKYTEASIAIQIIHHQVYCHCSTHVEMLTLSIHTRGIDHEKNIYFFPIEYR